MECSKTGKMNVRNCTEIQRREVCVGCLGLALVTRALRSWPRALPLGTRCTRGLGFKAMPRLCLGDSRAALVAPGFKAMPQVCLGDLRAALVASASRPCLGFALVTRALHSWPRAPPLGMRSCLGFALATSVLCLWPRAPPSGTLYDHGLGQRLWPQLRLNLNKNTNMINM